MLDGTDAGRAEAIKRVERLCAETSGDVSALAEAQLHYYNYYTRFRWDGTARRIEAVSHPGGAQEIRILLTGDDLRDPTVQARWRGLAQAAAEVFDVAEGCV